LNEEDVMKLRILWVGLAVLAAFDPVYADRWPSGSLLPGGEMEYTWTNALNDSATPHLNTGACGTLLVSYEDDFRGTDTAAAATLYSCPSSTAAIANCTSVAAFTSDDSGTIYHVRPPWLAVDTTAATGAATAEARVTIFCGQEVGSSGGSSTESTPALDSFTPGAIFNLCDLDDCAGVADGAGADPNPFPGSLEATVQTGVLMDNNTNSLWPIYTMLTYNFGSENLNLPSWSESTELNFQTPPGIPSGPGQLERYIQYTPSTHLITISAGGTGAISYGMNITFSNGAICRPYQEDASLVGGAVVRMNCVDHIPPIATNTITDCTGPSSPATCGVVPTGTVSAVVDDKVAIRPNFYEIPMSTNLVYWHERRGPLIGGATPYWVFGNSGTSTLHLGWGGYNDVNPARVAIPANASAGACTVGPGCSGTPIVQDQGDIAIDRTNGGTFNSTNTFGGQFRFATNQFVSESISPTQTACAQFALVADTSDDVNFPFTSWPPITIVAAGCRNDTSAAPATPATITLENLAGTSIPLTATLTCSGNASAMAWQTASTPWGNQAANVGSLASGGGFRFDTTNTPNPAIDSHTICIAYRSSPQ
jgi:hypothetical protein